jgi:hypothetical protein
MIPTDNAQEELAAIRASLARAVESANTQEWPKIVRNIVLRVERVINRPDRAPAQIGKKSGLVTAERGSEYFRKIVAMRKTRGGSTRKDSRTPLAR